MVYNFTSFLQSISLVVIPPVIKYLIKMFFNKSWDIFTYISYGSYGDIIKNSEIIIVGPLKHKNEYNSVAILSSINYLLKNIKYASWLNKSFVFKIICSAIIEERDYVPSRRKLILYHAAFLFITSFIFSFLVLVIYSWTGMSGTKPFNDLPSYLEIFNWPFYVLDFFLHKALYISIILSTLVVIGFMTYKYIKGSNFEREDIVNKQLCQIIFYIYYLYDLNLYDTAEVLNKYIDKSSDNSSNLEISHIYNWGQKNILKNEYIKKYTTFMPPVVAGSYLLPYEHLKVPARPAFRAKIYRILHRLQYILLITGAIFMAVYWYCQAQGFNIIDNIINILHNF